MILKCIQKKFALFKRRKLKRSFSLIELLVSVLVLLCILGIGRQSLYFFQKEHKEVVLDSTIHHILDFFSFLQYVSVSDNADIVIRGKLLKKGFSIYAEANQEISKKTAWFLERGILLPNIIDCSFNSMSLTEKVICLDALEGAPQGVLSLKTKHRVEDFFYNAGFIKKFQKLEPKG